jgi:uncharacterized membrane protein YqjE
MGIGVSVFLLAVGAILTFAIDVDSSNGLNINTVGVILMVAGAIGLLWALMMTSRRGVASTTVVEERPVRRVYEDPV